MEKNEKWKETMDMEKNETGERKCDNVISDELLEAYKGVAPATLGHMSHLRFMDSGIKPVYRRCHVVGRAFTIWAPGGIDALILDEANTKAQAGDVIVVDRGGDTEYACIGEFRALADLKRGIAGWVVDGAVCDVVAIGDMGFPTFSRSVSALIAKSAGLEGAVQVPISCGGVVVNPGDMILGDDDGVVVLSPEEAERLLPKCLEVEQKEIKKREGNIDILTRNKH